MNSTGMVPEVRALTSAHLWMLVATRFMLNAAFRIIYPLLPFLALRLEVSNTTINLLVTTQVASGLLSLFGGALADRLGNRTMMLAGLTVFVAGSAVCASADHFMVFFIGYTIIGISTAIHLPAVQSYVSHHTPYSRRGRALGTVELSWSLAGLIATPLLTGLVEVRGDWTPAFMVLLVGGLLGIAVTGLLLPPEVNRHSEERHFVAPISLLRRPSILAMIVFLWLALSAQEILFIVQSAWQERFFGLDTGARGQLFGIFGLAELVGALGVTLFADRIGLRRAALLGFTATALVYLLLLSATTNLLLYSVAFFLLGLCFEFSIVSSFPLVSELAPAARATTLALGTAAITTGRAVGATIGEPLWSHFGAWSNSVIACTMMLVGVVLAARYVREGQELLPDAQSQ